ncbi:MAG: site-2 protease family protein [Myxococcota bacterium]|jgi:membrane-associated protease RseP (regulator of RpoE activity)|nr:site-2 protease family protein [Myxococcota bacterium]
MSDAREARADGPATSDAEVDPSRDASTTAGGIDADGSGEGRSAAPRGLLSEWAVPVLLFVATIGTTLYGGAMLEGHEVRTFADLAKGWVFALPLLAILLTHELGHYVAGRLHGVDLSPPHFIPMPTAFGTLGAIIRMRARITRRDALLDVGAAGPLAGLVVAIPVLIYGLATSEVKPMTPRAIDATVLLEGHSILYELLLFATHGPMPEGHDVFLTSTALAGWAGLLLTLINLVPFGQLDGGHIAYALFGAHHERLSRVVLISLPVIGVVVGLAYGLPTLLAKEPWDFVLRDFAAGMNWIVWGLVLTVLARVGGGIAHPPTDDGALSPGRRRVAWLCLVLFVLLFMPSWMRTF